MASEQNRHRILYLLKYFQEKSDEKNGVSIRDMQSDLRTSRSSVPSVTTSLRSVGRANACISLPAGILNWRS